MSQWYYQQMGQEVGPVTAPQLKQLAKDGDITEETFVRREGETDWRLAHNVKGLFGAASDPPVQTGVPLVTPAPSPEPLTGDLTASAAAPPAAPPANRNAPAPTSSPPAQPGELIGEYRMAFYPSIPQIILGVLGFLTMLYYLEGYETTVTNLNSDTLTYQSIHNIGLLNNRLAGMVFGACLVVVGCIPMKGRIKPRRG